MRLPEVDKHKTLLDYALLCNLKVFVETGTYKGDTVKAMLRSRQFDQIHTVEVYVDRAKKARSKFKNFSQVTCWHGDSGDVLSQILQTTSEPALFWLDAHHSGKSIARVKGLISTPIMKELEAILTHRADHVVLIDDAHYYNKFSKKCSHYPSLSEVYEFVTSKRPSWIFDVHDDIIRTYDPNNEKTR